MSASDSSTCADVCLIPEGTYPYVTGGVSSWTQDLLLNQTGLTFHVVSLLARNADLTVRYATPANVVSTTNIFVQVLPAGGPPARDADALMERLEGPLTRLQSRGGLDDLVSVLKVVAPNRATLGTRTLLNSHAAWNMLQRVYRAGSFSSFLDYFWSARALLSGLYGVLLAPLPPARIYYAVSTGYAGLYAARAHVETGRPAFVTEHGIYTNERRVELAMANWLHEAPVEGLGIDAPRRTLKDLWVDTFIGYSKACYEACSEIITLYSGNQQFQEQDGAPRERLRVIPNGVDCARYAAIRKDPSPRPPTVALIGRVVPIKDVKTLIRATALLRVHVPNVQVLVIGPTNEDKDYYRECVSLVEHLRLQATLHFTGRVQLDEYLGKIDVVVLTSISEAQPLVMLEAGAAGLPIVATDVGASRELIHGTEHEDPPLGPGGAITPLCDPAATARAIATLLTNPEWYGRCADAMRERVRTYYDKGVVDRTYSELYDKYRTWPA